MQTPLEFLGASEGILGWGCHASIATNGNFCSGKIGSQLRSTPIPRAECLRPPCISWGRQSGFGTRDMHPTMRSVSRWAELLEDESTT